MRDLQAQARAQARAVLREHDEAVALGATVYAARIRAANPDLFPLDQRIAR